MFGWTKKQALIDLTSRQVQYQNIDDGTLKQYLGGRGLNIKALYEMTAKETDPLGPDNPLIFAAGPLTGTLIPANGRYGVTAKSPLTGILGDGNAAGFWASELKYAGFDQLVIIGKSEEPVYLFVTDGKVEIRDAEQLWGKDIWETDIMIKEELQDDNVQVSAIGQAGENVVRYACIINNLKRAVGRCGMGAVMGSKRLKAIAVRGTQALKVAHPQEHQDVVDNMLKHIYNSPGYPVRSKLGTTVIVDVYMRNGTLPIQNAQVAYSDEIKQVTSDKIAHYTTGLKGCFACPIHCSRFTKVNDDAIYNDAYSEGPEFESILALGPRCGNYNLPSILKLNQLTNQFGLDSISTGGVIAFLMECYQRGLIKPDQVDNLELTWGNHETIVTLVRKIALREGCGEWLARGVRRLSQDIPGSEEFALHIKGLEPPEQEPRGMKAWGLGWAVSSRGADHLRAFPLAETTWTKDDAIRTFGQASIVDRLAYEGKDVLVKWSEEVSSLADSLTICKQALVALSIPLDMIAKALWTVTGWEVEADELLIIGERITNLERMYNARLGLGRADDRLPKRYEQPLKEGASQGEYFNIEKLLDGYYKARGWDVVSGIPTPEKLKELGLGFTLGA
ncbi:MAG TPA: aldehyde ferredoxin oxidoreductase family protein [Clostridiales bacterium]|nr:aldehyde ferredoxin oxidoreductase family protein [Clostridiales bacterium]